MHPNQCQHHSNWVIQALFSKCFNFLVYVRAMNYSHFFHFHFNKNETLKDNSASKNISCLIWMLSTCPLLIRKKLLHSCVLWVLSKPQAIISSLYGLNKVFILSNVVVLNDKCFQTRRQTTVVESFSLVTFFCDKKLLLFESYNFIGCTKANLPVLFIQAYFDGYSEQSYGEWQCAQIVICVISKIAQFIARWIYKLLWSSQ